MAFKERVSERIDELLRGGERALPDLAHEVSKWVREDPALLTGFVEEKLYDAVYACVLERVVSSRPARGNRNALAPEGGTKAERVKVIEERLADWLERCVDGRYRSVPDMTGKDARFALAKYSRLADTHIRKATFFGMVSEGVKDDERIGDRRDAKAIARLVDTAMSGEGAMAEKIATYWNRRRVADGVSAG